MGKSRVIMICNLEEGLFPQKNTPQDRHWQKNASVPPEELLLENGCESVHRMLGYIEAPGARE